MTRMTRDNQVKEVVQGLALGVLYAGVDEVPTSKLDLEFALGPAFRGWVGARMYPGLSDFIRGPNYIYLGFRKSARRNGVIHAAWEDTRGVWVPYQTMPHFTLEESLEMFASFAVVTSVDAWTRVGAAFVDTLESNAARRADR